MYSFDAITSKSYYYNEIGYIIDGQKNDNAWLSPRDKIRREYTGTIIYIYIYIYIYIPRFITKNTLK